MVEKIILKIIKFYQKYVSVNLRKNCRFYPSCSEYTVLSIEKRGALMGGIKGIIRILKCHPFNKGGVDLP
ncbi:MAG: membrane protein insertion efficiency factor YidD [bacterium]